MGDAMSISYQDLPSYKEGWRDGLHWLEEIRQWSLKYEQANMVPAETNARLANPDLASMGKSAVAVLLGERLRKAMM